MAYNIIVFRYVHCVTAAEFFRCVCILFGCEHILFATYYGTLCSLVGVVAAELKRVYRLGNLGYFPKVKTMVNQEMWRRAMGKLKMGIYFTCKSTQVVAIHF